MCNASLLCPSLARHVLFGFSDVRCVLFLGFLSMLLMLLSFASGVPVMISVFAGVRPSGLV